MIKNTNENLDVKGISNQTQSVSTLAWEFHRIDFGNAMLEITPGRSSDRTCNPYVKFMDILESIWPIFITLHKIAFSTKVMFSYLTIYAVNLYLYCKIAILKHVFCYYILRRQLEQRSDDVLNVLLNNSTRGCIFRMFSKFIYSRLWIPS